MKYDHLIFVQVEDGHIATSARAIDEKTIHSLYAYNMDLIKFPEVNISDPPPTKRCQCKKRFALCLFKWDGFETATTRADVGGGECGFHE